MKIYVASSWRNRFQEKTVEILRELHYEVYDFKNPEQPNSVFSWADVNSSYTPIINNIQVAVVKIMLAHPKAERGFKSDKDALDWADCCVMVLPCGASAHTEAGYMKGQGKPVYVFSPQRMDGPELMYKLYDDILGSFEELATVFAMKNIGPYYLDCNAAGVWLIKNGSERFFAGFDKGKAQELIARLNEAHRPNVQQGSDGGILVCWDEHDKGDHCDFVREI